MLCGLKSDVGQAKVSRNDIDLAMRNAALSSARHFFYVETSAKNNKQLDDLLVKCVYCVLIDPAKMEQKTGPAMVAAQKLAQLEEIRRQSKVDLFLVSCFVLFFFFFSFLFDSFLTSCCRLPLLLFPSRKQQIGNLQSLRRF